MKNESILLDIILSKNILEYSLLDSKLCFVDSSKGIEQYIGTRPKVGDEIVSYFPELIGVEEDIEALFTHKSDNYILETVYKNGYYINISIEHYENDMLLLLIQNVTDININRQKLLQDSNESLLTSAVLQKILDNQNAYIFVSYHNEIILANQQFLSYNNVDSVEALNALSLNFYKHFDTALESYDALFERVNDKEEYITVNNDTFILQASKVESTHQLFTLTRITNISNALQYDSLTKAHKKEYFNKQLEKSLLLEEKGAVVVLDLDNFKEVNDIYGHQVGDKALQEFSALIRKNIHPDDIFARWGGEEFLLLLKNVTLQEAVDKANALCKLVEKHLFDEVKKITTSLGVAWISENDTLHSILLRADKALYEAKNSGKNKVVLKMLKKSKN